MPGFNTKQIAFYLYFSGLILLVASLPLSKFTMSIAQFMLFGGWLIGGNIPGKLKSFFSNRLALLITSVFLLHLLGLWNTSDFNYAFKDLRIKLPILLLPLVLATSPLLTGKQFEKVIISGIAGVTISTLISLMIFLGIIHRPVIDIRDISIFISHIRLALLCCLAVFLASWLIYKHWDGKPNYYVVILLPIAIWLIGFIILIESLTGVIILFVSLVIMSAWFAYRSGGIWVRVFVLIILAFLPYSIYRYVNSVNASFTSHEKVDYSKLEKYTESGNEYYHYPDLEDYENGYPIWTYQCETEMEVQWNRRSQLNYDGKDRKGQELRFTLMRFLSSKGLRKDSAAVWKLTDSEIKSVENGIANVKYQKKSSLEARIHQSLWEIHNRKLRDDQSGHSLTQRIEYWNTAIAIIKQFPFTGVGTGDVPDAFQIQYEIMKSKLSKEWRLRSHNQYLSFGVAFGLPGLIWFLIVIIYPVIRQIKKRDFLYVSFALISIMSMLTEDTLETQAGVTFFALFSSLFLFVNPINQSVGGKKE